MNKILKKAVVLILCLTSTSTSIFGLMGAASACPESEEIFKSCGLGASDSFHELRKARKEFFNVFLENAKKMVCENLQISRELLDETIKNVKIEETFCEKTGYLPDRNLILVEVYNMALDKFSVKEAEANLAQEIALAFIDNYLHPDREDFVCRRAIVNAFADLCNKSIIPDDKKKPLNLGNFYDIEQFDGVLKKRNRRHLKYLTQKWLSEGKITPLEVLDKIKAGENFKDILIEKGIQTAFVG